MKPIDATVSSRRAARAALVLAALAAVSALAGVSCQETKKRTELLLGVATDLSAPSPLRSVKLTVFRLPEMLKLGEQDYQISGDIDEMYELPGTYAVYSENGTADRILVRLRGFDELGVQLVTRKALLTMVPQRTLFVRLGIVSACRSLSDCDDDDQTTCIEGRCTTAEIDTTLLPEYQAGMEKTVACQSGTTFVNTSTKIALPVMSTQADAGAGGCGQGTCQEGVCFSAAPGQFALTKGPMSQARSGSVQIGASLTVLADGRVLLPGGLGPNGTPVLDAAELYDPASGTFAATGKMTAPRTFFGASKLADGRVLIVGGIDEAATALASAELYDPKTGTFTATAMPMTVGRVFPGTTTLADGRVLIVGGVNQIASYALGLVSYRGGLDSAELYDPVTDTFTAAPGHLVESRAFAQLVPVTGGAIVMCGEFQGGPRATLERFDAATGTFGATPTTLPPGVTTCISGLNALLPDQRLLVTTPPNGAWLYDLTTDKFTSAGGHPGKGPGSLGGVLKNGDVLFAGNFTAQEGVGKRGYIFNRLTRSFAFVAGELSVERTGFMSAVLPSGDVLIAGGGDATAEIFHRP